MSINLSTFNSSMKLVKVAIIKSAIKNLLIFSPLILGMMIINYLVDPGGLFKGKRYEEGIAKILMQGLNVANIGDCDERLLQMYYIKEDKEFKDIIVLGSSRGMQINPGNLDYRKFFNHSVSGSTLEDFFAITEMYEQQNKLPNTVILGLDPWILNKNNGQDRWKSISIYYNAFMNRLISSKKLNKLFSYYDCLAFEVKKGLNLISSSYFQISLLYLARHKFDFMKNGKIEYYPTKLDNLDIYKRLDANVKLADGTISYGKNYILGSRGDVKNYISQDPMYSLGEFYELDLASRNNFEKFIEYLLKKNIKVIFFLSPYHPYVYKYLINSTRYEIIEKVENYFRSLGAQKHIAVIGSYDPQQCGFAEEDFYDGNHPTREAVSKLSGLMFKNKHNNYNLKDRKAGI